MFVSTFQPENLATELNVDLTTIYQWMRGEYIPRPQKALAIVEIARREGVKLTLEDIYVRDVKSNHEEKRNEKNKALAPA